MLREPLGEKEGDSQVSAMSMRGVELQADVFADQGIRDVEFYGEGV